MTRVHCAPGAVRQLGAALDGLGAGRVLLVTGDASFRTSGAQAAVAPALAGRVVERVAVRAANPTLEQAIRVAERLAAFAPDAVLAVGGGSPLDTAKLALAFTTGPPRAVATGAVAVGAVRCPLLAVPTTAGTGSEVTHFAVVYVDGRKHSVVGEGLRPVVALVDAELSASMPPRLTACSGLDALCQAMEAHWSLRATDSSRRHSHAALHEAWANLPAAVACPTPATRQAMSHAALEAGRAIDQARTTAAHAMSYHLTSRYGVPHGAAVALLMPAVLAYNAAAPTPAVEEVVDLIGGPDAPARWRALLRHLGLPATLDEVGCRGPAARDALARAVDPLRLANNPRPLGPDDLRRLVA